MRRLEHRTSPFWRRILASLQRRLAPRGYEIARVRADDPAAFVEPDQTGALKFSERIARASATGGLETPEERVLEMAAASFIGDARRLLCVGHGTGVFERFVAVDPALEIVGLVQEPEALEWCRAHRTADQLSFTGCGLAALGEQGGEFDLVLSLGGMDSHPGVPAFLAELAALAPRAVIATNNRAYAHRLFAEPDRAAASSRARFDAGELYWVLRAFYREVDLYGLPDPCVPRLERVNLFSTLPVLYAVCRN